MSGAQQGIGERAVRFAFQLQAAEFARWAAAVASARRTSPLSTLTSYIASKDGRLRKPEASRHEDHDIAL